MVKFNRSNKNPILEPDKKNKWESVATFNPSVVLTHLSLNKSFMGINP